MSSVGSGADEFPGLSFSLFVDMARRKVVYVADGKYQVIIR